MTPLRKLVLTFHVTTSVGWLGAVVAFLALAIVGLAGDDPLMVRAAYLAMDRIGWLVIVPASIMTLAIGLTQSLGSRWGLVRHYWVLVKFLITVVATGLLLVHMQPISHMADVAATSTLGAEDLRGLRIQLVVDAAAALVALFVATVLSVFKPRGTTRYGMRQQRARADATGLELGGATGGSTEDHR